MMVEQGGLRDLRPGEGVCMGTGVAASGNGGVKPEEHCPSECKHRGQNTGILCLSRGSFQVFTEE